MMSKDRALSSTNSGFYQIEMKGHRLKLDTGLFYKVSSYRCQLHEAEIDAQGAHQVKGGSDDAPISSLDRRELEKDVFSSAFSAWLQPGRSHLVPLRITSPVRGAQEILRTDWQH